MFIDALVDHLQDLAKVMDDIAVSVKTQIVVFSKKLNFLRYLLDFSAKRCIDHQILEDFRVYATDSVCNAAILSFLCLLKGKDARMAEGLEKLFSDSLKKFMPHSPEVTEWCTGLLEASKPSRSDKFLVGEIVFRLVDFLQEDLADDPLKDHVDFLKEGLVIMLTFLINPAKKAVTDISNGEGHLPRINTAISEVLSLVSSLFTHELEVSVAEIQEKIEEVKTQIRKLYVPSWLLSDFRFPTTNAVGSIDFILEKLGDMVANNLDTIVFSKVMIIYEELLSLKPLLQYIMGLRRERKHIKLLQKRIINLVFLAEYVISSCFGTDHPIWYDFLRLSEAIDTIKLIETEVKMCSDQIYQTRLRSKETDSSHPLMGQAGLEDLVVGREEESMKIMEKLTRGTTQLDFVSIVGMPGLGKTTIAKKLYNDPSVVCYFHRRAWCCVSQEFNLRDLYLNILTDVTGVEARHSESSSTDNDLAEKLRKSLKQRRYLIVLDDIWNIEAWDSIKYSLPDDNNGSRIILTSRIHDLVSQAKPHCTPHTLQPLSDEESWDLLQQKLFHNNSSPPDEKLSEIGKNIAKHCQGLPLSVVLVAGILAGKNMEFWEHIEEGTSSQVLSQGCMDALELSYKHLPDDLKSCFLYFGAFPHDRVVSAKKLKSLWIAEGLIPRSDNKKSLYEVAEDYLSNLIGRSIVMVAERNYNGGIKACQVHDLLHDLCLVKIQEENFLQWVHDTDTSQSPLNSSKYENYRLCIHTKWNTFINIKPEGPFVHSLVVFGDYSVREKIQCPSAIFENYRHLKVLDVECVLIDGPFPEEITVMVHLRFLAIRCRAYELPSSISNLWNLETFILKDSDYIELPGSFWLMKSLRHVHIDGLWLEGLDGYEYGELEQLEILSTPYLKSGNDIKELLRRLPGLRKLKFYFAQRNSTRATFNFPELSCLTHLESLMMENCGEVFFGENYDHFPAFDLPNSLKKLTLEGFNLPWSAITVISQLPNLEVLKLDEAFSGRRWEVEDGEFSNLKSLELSWLDVEEWVVQVDPFPNLERLKMMFCQRLGAIPSGLGYIPGLNKIELHWCSDASARSTLEILEEQQEMGNDVLEVVIYNEFFYDLDVQNGLRN